MTHPAGKKAPTGRQTTAQGKEPSDAALGPPPPQNPSPEGAEQMLKWIPIGDLVTDEIDRKGPSGSEDFIYVDIGSVDRDLKSIVDPKSLPVAKAASRAKQILKSGDVLVSMTRPNLNAVAIVPPKLDGTIGSTGFHVLRASHADPRFLFYAVQTRAFVEAMCLKVQGALYPAVRPNDISTYRLPLFPLAEQRWIVAKIEELFSELDAGEGSLRRARRQLGVYRQSLLKQAFEGKLTVPWRKQNSRLLDTPWSEVEVSEVLTSKPPNGRSVKDRTGGFKVLRLTALRGGRIDLREYKEGDWDAAEAANHVVRKGDFLLSRGNGSIKLVGRGGVVMENADIAFPDTMIRLPLDLRLVDPSFFVYLWNSEQMRRQIEESARTTAGIYKINQSLLTRYRLPLCSLPEQREIVRLLDEQFTVIEQNEREIDAALKRSTALRQSILKKAFTGQLVPQDPTDESASALLERIRMERASITPTPPGKWAGIRR